MSRPDVPRFDLKGSPEDFVVEEHADLKLKKTGAFTLYKLTKKGWNTVSALQSMAEQAGLDFRQFSYGGKKDKYALTTQYFTVEGRHRPLKVDSDALRVETVGRMERAMGPDLITDNGFKIVVRGLSAGVDEASARLKVLGKRGFENYFDDKRFGGYDPDQGFLAEKVLKGHLNGAVKFLVTAEDPEDTEADRARKAYFFEHWREWELCREAARTPYERRVFHHLCRRSSDYLGVLKELPRERLSLAIAAYQGCLWNELLRRILREAAGPKAVPLVYPGAQGDYLFASDPGVLRALEGLELPTLAAKMDFADRRAAAILEGMLAEIGVDRSLFNKMKLRQAYFKSAPRAARVIPTRLEWKDGEDERHPGCRKLELSFALPRGSYATMLIKYLFAVPDRPDGSTGG